ncbi:hypothetical protein NUACC21_50850 [Scytonema sp. NUACC21]
MSKKLRLTQSLHATLIALTIGLVGCNNPSNVTNISSTNTVTSAELTNNLPKVVATTSILCDLTRQIAQETINLTCLIPPDTNPRNYEPKPEDSQAVEQAQLILYSGYNFEPAFIKLIKTANNNGLKVAVAQRAVSKPLKFKVDGKAIADPYIWQNAKNAANMVDVVSRNLAKTIPENASLYDSNAQKIKQEIAQIDSWIEGRIDSIPEDKRKLITHHHGMAYYAKAYNLSYASAVKDTSPEGQPSLKRTKALAKYIKKNEIPTIFGETTNNSNAIANVAQQAKVKISERKLFIDSLGQPGSEADTYQKMMVANTRTIVEGLGGTYLIFEPIIK